MELDRDVSGHDKFWMGKPQPHISEREAKPIVTTRWRNESGPPFCHPVPNESHISLTLKRFLSSVMSKRFLIRLCGRSNAMWRGKSSRLCSEARQKRRGDKCMSATIDCVRATRVYQRSTRELCRYKATCLSREYTRKLLS